MSVQEVRLSRGFETTPSNEKMSKLKLVGKSVSALVVGVLPFVIANLALYSLKGLAYLGSRIDTSRRAAKIPRYFGRAVQIVSGVPGTLSAAVMLASAKVFALSQTLVWKHYVKNPSGDGTNTRLAWYGASNLARQDFITIAKAFYVPNKLRADEWNLSKLSRLKV